MYASPLMLLFMPYWVLVVYICIRKYWRWRDVGFIWLAIALAVWPVLRTLLSLWESKIILLLQEGRPVGWYPFCLVEEGRMSIGELVVAIAYIYQGVGATLILIALLTLGRQGKEGK